MVTGGSGFIGSHLAEKLLALGNRVTVLDNIPLEESKNIECVKGHKDLTFVRGDIRDKKALETLVTKDTHKIFHLAAIVGVDKYCADPMNVIDVNIGGTRNILELAQKHSIKVIFTSTSEIYGKNPNVPWSEDDDRVLGSTSIERWSYSTSKAVCEHMIHGMHKNLGLPVVVVRYFNVYGPRQEPQWVISRSIYKVLRGEQPLIYDNGDQTRCFTFIDDAVQGTIMAAESKKASGQVFNIGNNKEITMREVVKLIIKISGKNTTPKHLDTKQHYGEKYEDIPRRIPDVSKAKQLLDWQAETPLEEGIKKTIEWAQQNQWWLA